MFPFCVHVKNTFSKIMSLIAGTMNLNDAKRERNATTWLNRKIEIAFDIPDLQLWLLHVFCELCILKSFFSVRFFVDRISAGNSKKEFKMLISHCQNLVDNIQNEAKVNCWRVYEFLILVLAWPRPKRYPGEQNIMTAPRPLHKYYTETKLNHFENYKPVRYTLVYYCSITPYYGGLMVTWK